MTFAAFEPPSTTPPRWRHCGHGATPADPVGCRGLHIGDHTACLAHLTEADRDAYLTTLSPGTGIDHRGTPFAPELLHQLLDALRDPTTGQPHIGDALFDGASFSGDARFEQASFSGTAGFSKASFSGTAWFEQASFFDIVRFDGASFSDIAWFEQASFSDIARFDEASFSDTAFFGLTSFSGFAGFSRAAFSDDARFSRASFFSNANFSAASLSYAGFHQTSFSGDADFSAASFSGSAAFVRASFSGNAFFHEASFARTARFDSVSFSRNARFSGASFSGDAVFDGACFSRTVAFGGVSFSGAAEFDRVSISVEAQFAGARFEVASRLGPLVCDKRLVLDAAVFQQPITLEVAAREVSCVRTRWASTAKLHLRYSKVDLADAVLEYPVLVAARPTPFSSAVISTHRVSETQLSDEQPGVRLKSVDGVDAAHLALLDIDLSGCRFAGAVHLDQLKVDGWCTFATTPTGWSQRFPWRWSRRNTLTEEHHWRARTVRHPGRAAEEGWASSPQDAPQLRPAAVAALYRQLRKSLEDGKNEPDAADFYYGECEMRRHDTDRPSGERALLTCYWALSGYGLRAVRALAWLAAAMVVTIAVMVLWGLPAHEPKPTTSGRQVAAGQESVLTTETPDPVNPTGPLADRVSTERLEKSLRVVINSVIFRSSGQDLTTTGTYTEMTSRLAEPVLLGLAVLAIRSRVKR